MNPQTFAFPFLMTFVLAWSGCGGGSDNTATTVEDPYETLAKQGATLECLPACLKALAMECTGSGTCQVAVATGSNASAGTSYSCYDSGLKVTSTLMTTGGAQNFKVTASLAGQICRQIDVDQSAAGSSYAVTNQAGTVIKASITSYPGLTVMCDNQTIELDRSTACGRLATLVLSGPKTPSPLNCEAGTCGP